jgi:PAS domain S-box-containing protein
MDAELALAKQRLDLALQSANAVAWDWDLASGRWACFGALKTVLGLDTNLIEGSIDDFRAWVHPDDRERINALVQEIFRSRRPFETEFRTVHRDGSARWVTSHGQVHCSETGTPERMLGIAVDVTARRAADTDGARWARRFHQFFEALPQICYFVDPDGTIADANPAACQAWGYGRQEIAGRPLATIIPLDLHERMWGLVERWRRTGRFSNEEMAIVTRTGERRTVLVSAGAVRDAAGNLLHSASVQTDITERKQAERELLELNAAIAHMNRVASMGEMAAALAHEVRQPLAALIGNAEAAQQILEHPAPNLDEVRSALADVIEEGNRLAGVVRNLRAVFRKETAPPRELDLNRVVGDIARLARTHLLLRGTQLVVDLAPEPVPVCGDESLLQQVIVNLLNNGVEAMERTPVAVKTLTVRTAADPASGTGMVRVEDVGPGIPPDEVPRLFTRFHTTKPDGLGMGLCVCQNIVQSLGGRISHEHGATRGATFQIALPLSTDRARGLPGPSSR